MTSQTPLTERLTMEREAALRNKDQDEYQAPSADGHIMSQRPFENRSDPNRPDRDE